jgi:hypothetical protein
MALRVPWSGVTLNAGLTKPRRGFTPVAGTKKLGGKDLILVDLSIHLDKILIKSKLVSFLLFTLI